MLSSKETFGNKGAFQYFIGYISNVGIIPVYIKLPQIHEFVKYFDNNSKCMNLLVHDEETLEKYNTVWDKINNLFKKEFDSEPVYNDKYVKARVSLIQFKLLWQ